MNEERENEAMTIREMNKNDIPACADILCAVYNNELWMCRWEKGIGSALLKQVEGYIAQHGLAGMTLSTNKYAPAPKFYEKNGFGLCEHVIFMAKEME